ncbi:glycerol kinase GlpK [Pedobacter arcticus]|uniref:glycerol kinase GlpK n=1 Tax=Pedobacter arcticus TaxID=752140 RepID=UPI00030DDD4C|nr:glycerol kinase GlpK [Pedobacter arcticus]
MSKKYILALDQGTSSSRAMIFDKQGKQISLSQKEFNQIYPQKGWVEHDPLEIWESQLHVAKEALKQENLSATDIAAVGITNQRETTIIWDKKTGIPICNAIVWQDRRTADFCDQLKKEGKTELVQAKTGLLIDAYFSATKISWILDNIAGARVRADAGELLFGTVDCWLIWKLTNGETHVTDVSNASRTMIFNIHDLKWDDELLQIFNIPKQILPEVKSCSEVYGATAKGLFETQIEIAGIAGDQQAALFGQLCTQPGMAKNTYGTGCFMLMNIGKEAVVSRNNLITTVAWQINGETTYALEGSVFMAGAIVQWLRDGLGIINSSTEVTELAEKSVDNGGVYLVPAFTGLGAPHWNPHAKGTIFGLTRGTTDAELARAALESIAYQTMDILKAMEADSGTEIKELRVDGGASINSLLMQFQADILDTKIIKPKNTETTAIGAAYLAGLAVGFWSNIDEIRSQWEIEVCYYSKNHQDMKLNITKWQKAIDAVNYWSKL